MSVVTLNDLDLGTEVDVATTNLRSVPGIAKAQNATGKAGGDHEGLVCIVGLDSDGKLVGRSTSKLSDAKQAEVDANTAAASAEATKIANAETAMDGVLTKLEAGTATNAQVQTALAKVIRYIRGSNQ